jgi:hypothetical protein
VKARTPIAEIVHSIEGRTRLRLPSARSDRATLESVATRLEAMPGVTSVAINAITGSLLIRHDEPLATIIERALAAGTLAATTPPGSAPGGLRQRLGAIPADQVGTLVLGALGVLQLLRKRVLPPAFTLFWYAATLAREMPAPHTEDDE